MKWFDVFKNNGLVSVMKTVDETKTLALFDDPDTIETFDFMLNNELADKMVSPIVERPVTTDSVNGVNKVAKYVLLKHYDNWKRIKDALLMQYDIEYDGGSIKTVDITETNDGNVNENNQHKEQVNAFNETTAVDSQNYTDTNAQTDNHQRTYHEEMVNKANSVEFTHSDVVEKEIKMRIANTYFDILKNDIEKELTLWIYDVDC
jgi:hypothetical protein